MCSGIGGTDSVVCWVPYCPDVSSVCVRNQGEAEGRKMEALETDGRPCEVTCHICASFSL